VQQRTPEWLIARVGKVTASRLSDVLATTKSGPSASRTNYLAELIVERLTGVPCEQFISKPMQFGIDNEDEARLAYEFDQDVKVEQVGFIDHPDIPNTGASPDGLVGDEGLLEIKVPNSATHLNTLLTRSIPKKYSSQMQWQLACTKRGWCDYMSYDPRMPPVYRKCIIRVEVDKVFIDTAEKKVQEFLAEVDQQILLLSKVA